MVMRRDLHPLYLKRLATFALFLALPGCLGGCEGVGATSKRLHHDYYVRNGSEGLILDCKLGYPGDLSIGPDVTSVEWNHQAIVVTIQRGERTEHYIIEAAEAELECGNNDVLHGPLSEAELTQKRKMLGLPERLGERARF